MYGPVIEGSKVRLRPHTLEDAPYFVRFLSDQEVTIYLANQYTPGLDQELDWIKARATDPSTLGWTIEVDGTCVGTVGLDAIDYKAGSATVGIFIGDKSQWGAGITTEIAQLVVGYAFTQMPLRMIKAGYLEPNIASAKAQARIGLRETGRWPKSYFRNGEWVDHVLTVLMRDEWLATQPTKE